MAAITPTTGRFAHARKLNLCPHHYVVGEGVNPGDPAPHGQVISQLSWFGRCCLARMVGMRAEPGGSGPRMTGPVTHTLPSDAVLTGREHQHVADALAGEWSIVSVVGVENPAITSIGYTKLTFDLSATPPTVFFGGVPGGDIVLELQFAKSPSHPRLIYLCCWGSYLDKSSLDQSVCDILLKLNGVGFSVKMSRAAAPLPSLADELEKLAKLRDSGVLTDEEFGTKKAELLAKAY